MAKNFSYNLFYQVLSLILPLITIPIISRTLGAEAIGIYSYTNATTQYFILFGSLGIQTYGVKQIAYLLDDSKKVKQTFWEIYTIQLIFSICSLLLYVIAVITVFKEPIYFAQSIFVLSIVFDVSWLFAGLELFKKIVFRNSAVKICGLFLIILFVKSPNDLIKYTLFLSVANLFGQFSMWIRINDIIGVPKFNIKRSSKHIMPAFSLFLPQIAITIYTLLDKSMLGNLSSFADVGIYDQGQKIIRVILAIVPALSTVVMPRIAYYFSEGKIFEMHSLLRNTSKIIWIFSFGVAFGLLTISSKFVPWFYGIEFNEVSLVFYYSFPLILAVGGANLVASQYLIPTNQHNKYTVSVLIAAVFNFFLNLYFIPKFGFIGACISTVFAEFIGFFIQVCFVRAELGLKIIFNKVPSIFLSAFTMFICVRGLTQNLQSSFLTTFVQIIVGTVVYILCLFIFKVINIYDINQIKEL